MKHLSVTSLKPGMAIAILCVIFYGLTAYGGIRAPDAEVVFRVAENLADGKGFGVSSDLENWRSFGVAYGRDSTLYSVYPPGESIALVPFILIGKWINQTGWYANLNLPLSHYVNDGLRKMIYGKTETNLAPHALRLISSVFNVCMVTLGVLIFFNILLLFTRNTFASLSVSLLYAFGTMIWHYAGTFFSEPLTMVWILASFYFLLTADKRFLERQRAFRPHLFFLSGIMLGLALITHTNSALLIPFYLWHAARVSEKNWKVVFLFLSGIMIFVFLLGYYNWMRFGNWLETGRNLSQYNPVDFTFPLSEQFWINVFAILLGYGKGLLWFCPAVLLGALTWNSLKKNNSDLSKLLGAMIIFVIGMVSSYSYWHGGFCLGPRYLMMIIPFCLFPVAFWLKDKTEISNKRMEIKIVAAACSLAVFQQIYFCVGELFSFYHVMKWSYLNKGIDIFINDRIYIDWLFAPTHQLLTIFKGPFFLRSLPLSNQTLWVVFSFFVILILSLTLRYFYPKKTNTKTPRSPK